MIALECLADKVAGISIGEIHLFCRLQGQGSVSNLWMPQTAAPVALRVKALAMLIQRFPHVCWKICIEQIKPGSRIGSYSDRPRWPSDTSGAGQVVPHEERYDFNRRSLDLLIAWPSHNAQTPGDLVESIQGIPEEDQNKVWDLIDEWSRNAGEAAKAVLRERIRRFAFTRIGSRRNLNETTRARARAAYVSLQSNNPVILHRWLFVENWVQESADKIDEIVEEDFDYRKREERIDRLRREAMNEIWTGLGFEGVKESLTGGGAAGTVGHSVASCVTGVIPRVDFIRRCLSLDAEFRNQAKWCLQGFLIALQEGARAGILQAAAEGLPAENRKRLFVCPPFQASTWRLLDG